MPLYLIENNKIKENMWPFKSGTNVEMPRQEKICKVRLIYLDREGNKVIAFKTFREKRIAEFVLSAVDRAESYFEQAKFIYLDDGLAIPVSRLLELKYFVEDKKE